MRLKKLHYALPSLQRCFKCSLRWFTSLPSAFCLLATVCTHVLKSQFASNPLSIYLWRWIERNAHSIRIYFKQVHRNANKPDPLCRVHVNAPLGASVNVFLLKIRHIINDFKFACLIFGDDCGRNSRSAK